MAIVVDASIAAAWCLPHEQGSEAADVVAMQIVREQGIVPGIFWYEIRNVLLRAERSGRIHHQDTEQFLQRLDELRMEADHGHNGAELLELARRHRMSSYDAAYLETAIRNRASLATLDADLASAATREGVEILIS